MPGSYLGYLGSDYSDFGAPASMAADTAASGGTGWALGGPAGAAVMVSGNFLSQLLAQKAADERNRRELMANAAHQHAGMEQSALNSMLQGYGRLLR